MAGLDLGKQVGPLPLGAWIVVVGGGLGIAYYTKRSGDAVADPEINTGGQPGVGDGTVGGWTPTQPTGTSGGTDTAPTTNEEWAYKAKQHLMAKGYPATTVSSAIDKYINGITPSIQEYTLVGIALAAIGPLPQALPTGPAEPDPTTPTPTTPGGTVINPPPAPTVSAAGRTTLDLKWGAPTGNNITTVGYRIYLSNGRNVLVLGKRFARVSGLKPNTLYKFQVASIARNGTTSRPSGYGQGRTKK